MDYQRFETDYRVCVPSLIIEEGADREGKDCGALAYRCQRLLTENSFAGVYGHFSRLSLYLLTALLVHGRARAGEEYMTVEAAVRIAEGEVKYLYQLCQHAANKAECCLELEVNGQLCRFSPDKEWSDPLCGSDPTACIEEMMAAGAAARRPYVSQCLFLLARTSITCSILNHGGRNGLTLFMRDDADNALVSGMLERGITELQAPGKKRRG